MSGAKLIKHIPSGKRLPYWDRYEYECIDCGEHFTRATYTSRINPYCAQCYKKHEREKAKENKLRKQELHDKEIRNKAIDEFAEKLKKKWILKNGWDRTDEIYRYIDEISEQLKAGGKNE